MLDEIGKDFEDFWLNLYGFPCTVQFIILGIQFVETKDTNHGKYLANDTAKRALPSLWLW